MKATAAVTTAEPAIAECGVIRTFLGGLLYLAAAGMTALAVTAANNEETADANRARRDSVG